MLANISVKSLDLANSIEKELSPNISFIKEREQSFSQWLKDENCTEQNSIVNDEVYSTICGGVCAWGNSKGVQLCVVEDEKTLWKIIQL